MSRAEREAKQQLEVEKEKERLKAEEAKKAEAAAGKKANNGPGFLEVIFIALAAVATAIGWVGKKVLEFRNAHVSGLSPDNRKVYVKRERIALFCVVALSVGGCAVFLTSGSDDSEAVSMTDEEALAEGFLAQCNDGSYSDNPESYNTCSSHDGVDHWLAEYGECDGAPVPIKVEGANCNLDRLLPDYSPAPEVDGSPPDNDAPPITNPTQPPATAPTTRPPDTTGTTRPSGGGDVFDTVRQNAIDWCSDLTVYEGYGTTDKAVIAANYASTLSPEYQSIAEQACLEALP